MAFFFKRKMPESEKEMRMRLSAPSFLFREGEVFSVWTLNEAKGISSSLRDRIVIVHPGVNMLSNPRAWIRVFSCSYYLIICAPPCGSVKTLVREAERVIYGISAKTLSGVAAAGTAEEAGKILSALMKETGKTAVTVNNTEEDF